MHEILAQMMPKYPPHTRTTHGQQKPDIQCARCNEACNAYKGRKLHQQKSGTCQIQRKIAEKYIYLRPFNDDCSELSPTSKQLIHHLLAHWRSENKLRDLNMPNNGKRMRRNQMTNIGVPIMQITRKVINSYATNNYKNGNADYVGNLKTPRPRKYRNAHTAAQRMGQTGEPERKAIDNTGITDIQKLRL